MVSLKSKQSSFLTSFKQFFKTDIGVFLLIAIAWQIVLTVIGYLLSPNQGALGHMLHWDAGWYQHIISQAYGTEGNPAAPAFYPLFPLLVALVHTVSFGLFSYEVSALLINTVALWAILVGLWRIFGVLKVKQYGKVAGILLLLSFPSAFFLHTFYSESVFIAIATWSYLFALQRRWWAVGLALAILTAARLPSLLFIGLCGLEYLRAYKWKIAEALNKNILWFLLAPLGFIAYGFYLLIARGDFLAMFSAYSATNDWIYQVFNLNIFVTLGSSVVYMANNGLNYEVFINYLLPFLSVVLIAASSIYILVKLKSNGIPLFIFGLISIILFTLNSNLVSVHRYALACIVIYIAIALFVQKGWLFTTFLVLLIPLLIVQIFIYSKFIHNIFAG